MNNLSKKIVENFDRIAKHFNLNVREDRKAYYGTCKCHDSDNSTSFTIYKDFGIWRCFTNACHEKFGKSAIGLIMGLLSKQKKQKVEFREAVNWLEKFIDEKVDLTPPNQDEYLTVAINNFHKPKIENSFKITKEQFINTLGPPTYYIKRGYGEQTLKTFLVGQCNNPAKLMYNRVMIPQFNEEGFVIGAIGRSVFEKCEICKNFHDPQSFCRICPKVLNTDNFPSESTLYNLHQAKPLINQTGLAIVTESNGNVWRLHEAGFDMGVSCFGAKFTSFQKMALDTTGAQTLIVVPDNDEAGQILVKHVEEKCRFSHNIVVIKPSYKDDIGNLNIETVKQILGPIVEKYTG